jgi:hypothetical protein
VGGEKVRVNYVERRGIICILCSILRAFKFYHDNELKTIPLENDFQSSEVSSLPVRQRPTPFPKEFPGMQDVHTSLVGNDVPVAGRWSAANSL